MIPTPGTKGRIAAEVDAAGSTAMRPSEIAPTATARRNMANPLSIGPLQLEGPIGTFRCLASKGAPGKRSQEFLMSCIVLSFLARQVQLLPRPLEQLMQPFLARDYEPEVLLLTSIDVSTKIDLSNG